MAALMLILSSKEKTVLEELLLATRPVSTEELGRRCGLSRAQVRYCLRTVEPWLAGRGLPLMKAPRVGLYLADRPTMRARLLEEVRGLPPSHFALTSRERVNLLLLRLLLAEHSLAEGDLVRDLGVSRSSFFRDLGAARRWLTGRRLALRTRRRQGVWVQGDEAHWREALVDLLCANLDEGQLVAFGIRVGKDGSRAVSGSRFAVAAAALLQALDIRTADGQLAVVEKELGGAFPDRARARLTLHLALSRYRLERGRPVVCSDRRHPDSAGLASVAIERARRAVALAVGSTAPASEAEFLTLRLAEAMGEVMVATDRVVRLGQTAVADSVSTATRELAKALAREAAKYLNARMFHDSELVECLALELAEAGGSEPSGTRSDRGDARRAGAGGNPLSGFVQRVLGPVLAAHGQPCSTELAAAIAVHLETALERHRQSSVRRRVWVVCGAGVATARNLITRLNLYLPQLEILGLASAFELAREPGLVGGADAVISTIPLDWLEGTLVLRVSPLLTTDDVGLLRRGLGLEGELQRSNVVQESAQVGLAQLLSARTVEVGAIVDNWEDVVDRAGSLLLSAGAVWPSYVEAMKDMIRLYGPYVVVAPGAALLHAAPDMGGKRLCFSLVALWQPVAFGHELNDPVSVALAFSAIDHTTHLRAVSQAMALLADPRAVQDIRAASTRERAMDVVNRCAAAV